MAQSPTICGSRRDWVNGLFVYLLKVRLSFWVELGLVVHTRAQMPWHMINFPANFIFQFLAFLCPTVIYTGPPPLRKGNSDQTNDKSTWSGRL